MGKANNKTKVDKKPLDIKSKTRIVLSSVTKDELDKRRSRAYAFVL